MNELIVQLKQQFAVYGPNLLAGLAVLVVGWLVAVLASFIVRKVLGKVSIDNKIAQSIAGPEAKKRVPIEHWAGTAVFCLIMLFVVIGFLQTIKLTTVSGPLNSLLEPVMTYLPRALGGGLLLVAAWIVATIVRKVLLAVLSASKLDEKMGGQVHEGGKPIALSRTFAEIVYWLIFLLFLPAILQALAMQSLLEPVTGLFNKVFTFLPNLLSALAIALVGWLIARIVQRIVQGLLSCTGIDDLSEKWGLSGSLGKQKLSGVLGLIVYFLILVPVIISALSALKLDAITQPASDMLAKIMAALPNVFGAMIIVLLAVLIGKVASGIVTNVLAGLGFNNVLVKLGLSKQVSEGKQTPSAWVGLVVFAFIVLLACVTACDMLGFPSVGVLIKDFIALAGRIFMGAVIFALGLLLSQIVGKGIRSSDSPHAGRLALAARVVVLALAGAMALRQTGLADEIINLAFGLTLGAAAVAAALAFGLGGRGIAERMLQEWRDSGSRDSRKPH
jgi:hypothetical protein